MKNSYLLFYLFLGFISFGQSEPLDRSFNTQKDLIAASECFADGNAESGFHFYKGILAGLVHIDLVLADFIRLDEEDAAAYIIKDNRAQCLSLIDQTREAVELYNSKNWPLQKEMVNNTLDWLMSVEVLMVDFIGKLAEPMSRPDNTWSDDELSFYDKYIKSYDKFLAVDDDWLEFQFVFAEANGFKIDGELKIEEAASIEQAIVSAEVEDEKEEYRLYAEEFSNGQASTGEDYYDGILGGILHADAAVRNTTVLDNRDASISEFMDNIDACLTSIKSMRGALILYTDKNWPKRQEFEELTIQWLNSVEDLMNNYIRKLAEPMSRPDDTWTEDELDFYDTYIEAFNNYLMVDSKWVDFQYVFAEANGFQIVGTVDLDKWNGSTGSSSVDEEVESENEK